MRNLIVLFLMTIVFFSCDKDPVKKEEQEILEPTLIQEIDTLQVQKKEIIPSLIFTVQIAALQNSNEKLANLENVNIYQENMLTKYRLGAFKTYKEARTYRNKLRYTYKDAFVQALENDVPISIKRALKQ